jgi:hypothetical protein
VRVGHSPQHLGRKRLKKGLLWHARHMRSNPTATCFRAAFHNEVLGRFFFFFAETPPCVYVWRTRAKAQATQARIEFHPISSTGNWLNPFPCDLAALLNL